MASMLGTVTMVISGLAFLLDAVALAIPYWLYYGRSGAHFNLGLWRACSNLKGNTMCTRLVDINGFGSSESTFLNATRGLVIVSVLLLFGAMVCHILKNCVMKHADVLYKISGICGLLGGAFGIAGCVVFADKFTGFDISSTYAGATLRLHAGFGLCIVASVKGIVSGIVSLFIRDRNY